MPNKIFLVVKREYLARVKKRSFIVATILTPLIFPSILGVFLWIGMSEPGEDSSRFIEVVDENQDFFLESNELFVFSYGSLTVEEAKEMVQKGNRYGFLYIPKLNLSNPTGITFYAAEPQGMSVVSG